MNNPRVVRLLDRSKAQQRGLAFGCCGARVRQRYVTTMGWKVTCEVCNPPTRRKVRIKPRPGSPALPQKDLETA